MRAKASKKEGRGVLERTEGGQGFRRLNCRIRKERKKSVLGGRGETFRDIEQGGRKEGLY